MAVRAKLYFLATLVALLSAGAADAAELCVKCSGPDANYACIVNSSSDSTIDTVAKFYCITALAKSGPHASCAIDRNKTAPCQGQRKELPLPAALEGAINEPQQQESAVPGLDAPAANSTSPASKTTGTPRALPPLTPDGTMVARPDPQSPSDAGPEQPPKTVQEMVEKGAKSAGDGISGTQKSATTALGKAGSAVGNAAKSSWKCLSSFFSNC